MAELTFISNKTRKETTKHIIVILFAVITWVLQVSIFSNLSFFDTTPNIILLSCIYLGLKFGPLPGTVFGIISSFLIASFLHDHVFYFSYPLVGLLAGLLIKNPFSDELLFFILLSFVLTFPLEFLNGWQYHLNNPINILDRYIMVSFIGAIINLCFAPFFYYFMKILGNKFKQR